VQIVEPRRQARVDLLHRRQTQKESITRQALDQVTEEQLAIDRKQRASAA